MSIDLTNSSPIPSPSEEFSQSPDIPGHVRTCPDIDPNYRLNRAQSRAIHLLLEGQRFSQIARMIGVEPRTLYRWRNQNRDFQNALADARADRQNADVERCQNYAHLAAAALAKIVDDPDHKDRVRAALGLLQHSTRLTSAPIAHQQLDYNPGHFVSYPEPLITPPPQRRPEPELEPKVG